jgi:hypothetical protein
LRTAPSGRYLTVLMNTPKTECGPTVDIVRTEGVRVARCPCGTVHLTLLRTGVTVQLAPDYFAEIAQALSFARGIVESPPEERSRGAQTAPSGGFVTVVPDACKKKPSN